MKTMSKELIRYKKIASVIAILVLLLAIPSGFWLKDGSYLSTMIRAEKPLPFVSQALLCLRMIT